MLKRYVLSSAMAILCAGVAASAQSPTQQPQAQQPAMEQAASKTVEGCVYREKDIPGRAPNVAERAGVLEDYILVADASASSSEAVGTSGTSGTAGAATSAASAASNMFKLEHTADDELSAVVGKRVRVTGKVDAEAGDKSGTAVGTSGADKSMGPDSINLPELEVSSIQEIEGTCPAKPAAKDK
jgi:hypothetical protein